MLSLGADLQIDTNRPYDHDDIVESWTSSNTNAVVIDNDGFLRVVGNGTSTITMVTQSGLKATTNITGFTTSSITIRGVTIQSDGSLPITSINLTKLMDGSKQLSATVKNEKDMLFVGYGAMVVETLLGVCALLVCGAVAVNGAVPADLIPASIAEYVKTHFPGTQIVKIDKERRGYEVELSNDLDLQFNKNGKFIGIDD